MPLGERPLAPPDLEDDEEALDATGAADDEAAVAYGPESALIHRTVHYSR